MKRLILFLSFLIMFFSVIAQQKSRKEIRAEKQAAQEEIINGLLESKQFVFNATEALPMIGGNIYLEHLYDLTIKGDTAIAFLPFYGVAYQPGFGANNEGGIKFIEKIKEYKVKKGKKNIYIKMEVKGQYDTYNMILSVSKLGYADLSVSCSRKQTIKFVGSIGPIERPITMKL